MAITYGKKSRKKVTNFELNLTDKDSEGMGWSYACLPTIALPHIQGGRVRYDYGIARDFGISQLTGLRRAKGNYSSLLIATSLEGLTVSYLAHAIGYTLCQRYKQLSKEVVLVGKQCTLILKDTRHPYSKLVLLHFTPNKGVITLRSQVGRLLSEFRDAQPEYHDTNLQDFATLVKVLVDGLWRYEAQQYALDPISQISNALTVAKYEAHNSRDIKLDMSNQSLIEHIQDLELFLLQCSAHGGDNDYWNNKLSNKIAELCKQDPSWQVWDSLHKGTPSNMLVLHDLALCPIGIDKKVYNYDLQQVLLQYELFEAFDSLLDSCLDGSYILPHHSYTTIQPKENAVKLDNLGLGEPFTLHEKGEKVYIAVKFVGGYAAIVPHDFNGYNMHDMWDMFALSLTSVVYPIRETE